MASKKIYIRKFFPCPDLKSLIRCLYYDKNAYMGLYANYTYSNRICTRIECTGKRRSFEDLLALAQTYFPETTEIELMKTLKELPMQFIFCGDIRKIVFVGYGGYPLDDLESFTQRPYTIQEPTYTAQDLINIYEQL